jgi:hypothetical protein
MIYALQSAREPLVESNHIVPSGQPEHLKILPSRVGGTVADVRLDHVLDIIYAFTRTILIILQRLCVLVRLPTIIICRYASADIF